MRKFISWPAVASFTKDMNTPRTFILCFTFHMYLRTYSLKNDTQVQATRKHFETFTLLKFWFDIIVLCTSHRMCIWSSFWSGQNMHEVSDTGVKQNLCTLTQGTPALYCSNSCVSEVGKSKHTFMNTRIVQFWVLVAFHPLNNLSFGTFFFVSTEGWNRLNRPQMKRDFFIFFYQTGVGVHCSCCCGWRCAHLFSCSVLLLFFFFFFAFCFGWKILFDSTVKKKRRYSWKKRVHFWSISLFSPLQILFHSFVLKWSSLTLVLGISARCYELYNVHNFCEELQNDRN